MVLFEVVLRLFNATMSEPPAPGCVLRQARVVGCPRPVGHANLARRHADEGRCGRVLDGCLADRRGQDRPVGGPQAAADRRIETGRADALDRDAQIPVNSGSASLTGVVERELNDGTGIALQDGLRADVETGIPIVLLAAGDLLGRQTDQFPDPRF